MKCVVPGINMKVFGRAIHSLSKIGEELYIEPLEHGLALRTVNSSRSAYACFLFAPSFFQHYDDGGGDVGSQDSDDDDVLRCKIAMKSILTVFRSLSTMEKTVERCKIHLNMKDSRLVFQLHCRHGIVKTHNLAFIECETLQAVFSKDMCPNSLTASSKLLCDAVLNFQNTQEEVTLIVNPQKICLKNYVDDEPDPTKVMHTNLSLDPDEFDNCQVGVDTEVTFCLKELRAILAFSDVTTLPLTLNFETAGRPIVFTIDSDSTFEGNFVLATLADQQTQAHQTQPRPTASQKRPNHQTLRGTRGGNSRVNKSSIKSQPSSRGDNFQNTHRPVEASRDRSQGFEQTYDDEELMNDDPDFEEMLIQNDTTIYQVVPVSTDATKANSTNPMTDNSANPMSANSTNITAAANSSKSIAANSKNATNSENTMTDKNISETNKNKKLATEQESQHERLHKNSSSSSSDSSGRRLERTSKEGVRYIGDNQEETGHSVRYGSGLSDVVRNSANSPVACCSKTSEEESPVLPMLRTKIKIGDTTLTEDIVMSEEEDEVVPGTPPAKRFRSLFFGNSQGSQFHSQPVKQGNLNTSHVLAADTDDED